MRLDALVVTDLLSIRHLCGFTGTSGALALRGGEAVFFTDSRYTLQARRETFGVEVREAADIDGALCESLVSSGVGYAGFEAEALTFARWRRLKSLLGRIDLVDVEGRVTRLRLRKTPGEVARLREAARLAEEAFREAAELLRPGVTEAEVARRFHEAVLRRGSDGLAFDTIVAAGPNGALPHAHPGTRPIEEGDLVVFDFGVRLDGYCSDETVTVPVGKVEGEAREVYGVVLAAQRSALAAVRPGAPLAEVDRAARDTIREAGYGDFFGHGTGHGVGLAVHESPTVSPRSRDTAREGMVFTVEPGVYLAGRFGVRIEDTVEVTGEGYAPVTALPKDWDALRPD
jgi:Xaa-Pro aminopeptidase